MQTSSGGSPSPGYLILAVDDDAQTLKIVRLALDDPEFHVVTAATGREARQVGERQRPDLVLLDLGLPDGSGLDVLRSLRSRSDVPVILLTGHTTDADTVRGLDAGADDYMAKPFNPGELAARVRAVLRRCEGRVTAPVHAGNLEIDLAARTVTGRHGPVSLTRAEWQLLALLASNHGKLLRADEVLTAVWGPEYRDELQYLRVLMSRLRAKLERHAGAGRLIRTFPGIGYALEPAAGGTAGSV